MRKILALFISALIIFAILLIYILIKINTPNSPQNTYYEFGDRKIISGEYVLSADGKVATIVGRLVSYSTDNGSIIGIFDLGGTRKKIIIYQEVPTRITYQKTLDLFPNTSDTRLINLRSLNDYSKVFDKLSNKNIVLTLLLDYPGINKDVLSCNSKLINSISLTDTSACIARTFQISAYEN